MKIPMSIELFWSANEKEREKEGRSVSFVVRPEGVSQRSPQLTLDLIEETFWEGGDLGVYEWREV